MIKRILASLLAALLFVNFFGTVFMKDQLEFDKNRYIDVNKFKFEGKYVVFGIRKTATNKMLGI